MLGKWGAATAAALTAVVIVFLALPSAAEPTPSVAPVTPGASAPPVPSESTAPSPVDLPSAQVRLKVERDGKLSVTETITVPDGKTLNRTAQLRLAAGDEFDRLFTVSDLSVDNGGSASVSGDQLVVRLNAGKSVLKYTVDGTIATAGDHVEMRWPVASGWDTTIGRLTGTFSAPKRPMSITCLAGPVGSTLSCTTATVDETQATRFTHDRLEPGERLDLAIDLPTEAAPANVNLDKITESVNPFALTPATAIGLAGLTAVLLAGVALLLFARGRDAKALATEVGPVDVLFRDEQGRVAFASPDGVLPGQVGTVADEHVDVVDVTATVIDLAVRNYLWIAEVPSPDPANGPQDWRIVRRNPADDALIGYERAVYDVLLPAGTDNVAVSELRNQSVNLTGVRTELYTDVVTRQWFARRPDTDRSRWWWTGFGVIVLGIAVTAVLAFTVGHALLGLAVVIAGIALALGARFMPARTKRGSVLLQQVRGLHDYLRSVQPEHIPDADREMVFSRSLPYALVLGESDHWLTTFATLDTEADGTPGLYWFGETEPTEHLTGFTTSFPAFVTALDEVLAKSGKLRS